MAEAVTLEMLESDAVARTGLSDFGGDDWREGAARLLDAARREARLAERGWAILRAQLVERLANRLEVNDWVARHPEVREERVEAPLVLATLPRTGQTAMGWILDRDPSNRSLLSWFAKRPCPPPLPGGNEDDPRIAAQRAVVAATPQAILDMHLYDAEEPDECHWLLSNALRTPHEIYTMHVPSYYEWVRDDETGMRAAYRYYQLQLKLLQSRTPGRRWVLKNSSHLLYLDALEAVLPDAIFVQFHRDPTKVLASNCRLSLILRAMSSDDVDPREVGESMLRVLCDYVEGLLRFRSRSGGRPWIDVRFRDFVADPLGAAEAIYDAAGLTLGAEARAAMARWVDAHPRTDLRNPRPAELAPFGIDLDRARDAFAEYCKAFDVSFDGI